jgi:hypothetical protein
VPVSAQISTSQSPLLQAKHLSISEHTSNSRPDASIIISCCCCWSRRAECCIVRFDMLELVEDADLLRGRFAAGYYALEARRSWHISIRGGKSGYLERVEMIGSSQEILCSVLAAQLDCRKDNRDQGKLKGLCRLLAIPSQKGDTLYSPLYTPAMPSMPYSFLFRQKCQKMPRRQCFPSYAKRSTIAARP